jgi:preprotein translocase subunit SecE
MNASTEGKTSNFDGLKWLLVLLLVAAGIGGNLYYDDQSLLYRVLALLVLAVAAIAIALQTGQGIAFWTLAKEARTEIRKVIWPTRQETVQTTFLVLAVVVIAALLLWLLDLGLGWIASQIIG